MDYARVNGKPGFNIRNPNTGKVEFVSIEGLEKQGKKDQFLKDLEKNTGKSFRQWEDSWIRRRGQAQLEKDTAAITASKENQNRNRWFITKAAGGKAAFDAGGGAQALKDNPNLTAADIQKRGMSAIRARQAQTPPPATPLPEPRAQEPRPQQITVQPAPRPQVSQTGDKAKDRESWEKANPRLAEVERLRAQQRSSGKSIFDKEFRQNVVNPVMYGKKSVVNSQKEYPDKPQSTTQKEEKMDAFDLVLEYLTSEGHVDTLDEALYVMMEMDSETIQTICEAAADQSDKQIDKGIKTTYKAGNVLDNVHQGRSRGLNRLSATERAAKIERMRKRLKARRDDLFGERNRREDAAREEIRKKYGL